MAKWFSRTAGQPDGHRTDAGQADNRTDTGQADNRTDTGQADNRTLSGAMSDAPWWVGWFTDIGRPLSAVVVMVLCAPGERHLAELAGWGSTLSWGMAGLLVMYAGIAAVVATVRPKGAPGKKTAVLGAIVSLMLAMAAQPVSHYFVTGWMTDQPRAPFWLVTVVSCVPPFVMGHLLHLAADPGTERSPKKVRQAPQERPATRTALGVHPDDVQADTGKQVDAVQQDSSEDDLSWGDAAVWTPETAADPDNGYKVLTASNGQRAGQVILLDPISNDVYPNVWTDTGQADSRTDTGQADSRTDTGQADSRTDTGRTPDRRTAGRTPDRRTAGRTPDRRTAGRTPDRWTAGRTAGRTPDRRTCPGSSGTRGRSDRTWTRRT